MAAGDQFYVTHCTTGDSVLDAPGYSVRASVSRDPLALREALQFPPYELPLDMWKDKPAKSDTPRRLARTMHPHGGVWVAHSAFLEKDTMGRDRSYFTHLLHLPVSSDAASVLESWDASAWVKEYPPGAAKTLKRGTLPVGEAISAASLTAFLTKSVGGPTDLSVVVCPERFRSAYGRHARGEVVGRFLKAYLLAHAGREAGGPRDRLFVHAEPGLVAMLLYAAARLLPPAFTVDLTFSTFEPAHRGLRDFKLAAVVGTYTGSATQGLDPVLTTSRGFVIDTFRPELSSPELAGPVVSHPGVAALTALAASGQWELLNEVRRALGGGGDWLDRVIETITRLRTLREARARPPVPVRPTTPVAPGVTETPRPATAAPLVAAPVGEGGTVRDTRRSRLRSPAAMIAALVAAAVGIGAVVNFWPGPKPEVVETAKDDPAASARVVAPESPIPPKPEPTPEPTPSKKVLPAPPVTPAVKTDTTKTDTPRTDPVETGPAPRAVVPKPPPELIAAVAPPPRLTAIPLSPPPRPVVIRTVRLVTREVALGTLPADTPTTTLENVPDSRWLPHPQTRPDAGTRDGLPVVAVSPDARRIAYPVRRGTRWVIHSDGKEGEKPYDEIRRVTFSPDGKRLAFAARVGDGDSARWMVVADGKEEKGYEAIMDGPVFSPNGKRLAYQALSAQTPSRPRGVVVVVDGNEWRPHELPEGYLPPAEFENLYLGAGLSARLRFSPDGAHVAAVVRDRDGYRVVMDGVPHTGAFRGIPKVRYNADGTRLAYVGLTEKGVTLVEGNTAKPYPDEYLRELHFTPDGKRLVLTTGGKPDRVRVEDEVVGEGSAVQEVVVSRDGSRRIFARERDDGWVVEVDGKEHSAPATKVAPHSLRFSPDGAHIAYAMTHGPDESVVVDGAAGRGYSRVARGSLTFGPNGRWLAYAAAVNEATDQKPTGRWRLVAADAEGRKRPADGRPTPQVEAGNYDEVWAARGFAFDGPSSFHLVAVRGREIFRVECDIIEE